MQQNFVFLAPTLSAGQLLCSGLFSKDTTNNWFAAAVMYHAIANNPVQKDNLLKVQLATKSNLPPVTLLQHIVDTVHQVSVFSQTVVRADEFGFINF